MNNSTSQVNPSNYYRIDLTESEKTVTQVGSIVLKQSIFKLTQLTLPTVKDGEKLAHVTLEPIPSLIAARNKRNKKVTKTNPNKVSKSKTGKSTKATSRNTKKRIK